MTSPDIVSYLTYKQSDLAAIGVTVDPNVPVHPCFLYESIWCLIGFVLLALYLKHRKFDGEVFLMYLAFYGAERAVVEGLRTDSLMIGSLRVSQLLAAVLVVVSVTAILVIRSKIKGSHDENYMKLFVLTEAGQAIANGGKYKKAAGAVSAIEEESTEAIQLDSVHPADEVKESEKSAAVSDEPETDNAPEQQEDEENVSTDY